MASLGKTLSYRLEYSGVLIMDLFFSVLPASVAFSVGEFVGTLFSFVLKKRDVLVKENLKKAFPEKSDKQINQIAKKVWNNLGRVAVEFIKAPRITKENYQNHFFFEGQEHVEKAKKDSKGIILATFHFANWEMAGLACQFDQRNLLAIARPIKNPFVEKWIQRKRRNSGLNIILHRQAVRASLRALKEKKMVGILVDQNLYQGGVFVDFFGRPAATTTLPALLHARTQAPVMVSYVIRKGKGFRAIYGKPIQFPKIENAEERLQEHTQIITTEIEKIIRSRPEEWFWIHNRWKRAKLNASS